MFQVLTDPLFTLVYPQECRICSKIVEKRKSGVVCEACWNDAEFFTGLETLCKKCGALLSRSEPLFETTCSYCENHFYETARALGPYKGPLAESILHLKKEPYLPGKIAVEICASFTANFQDETTLIIPVPLSRQRYRERGFNQAEVIAKVIAKEMAIPVDSRSLVRKYHTAMHRGGMDLKAREMSVKNAFEVKRPRLVCGQAILLVDDVLTSGATSSACAKALKQKGAATVNVLTLGRAIQ